MHIREGRAMAAQPRWVLGSVEAGRDKTEVDSRGRQQRQTRQAETEKEKK